MTPDEIGQIEAWLKTDTVFAFGDVVIDAPEIRAIERAVATEIGYVDRPGVQQLRGGEYATRVKERLHELIMQRLDGLREMVTLRVCPDYCALKAAGRLDTEAVKIATNLADSLITLAVAFPFPAIRTASYIVRSRMLDKWCDCSAPSGAMLP